VRLPDALNEQLKAAADRPDADAHGHRDGRDTDCPGDALYAWVHSTLGHDVPGPPPPQPPGSDTLEWP
jgi:hypothetical protein